MVASGGAVAVATGSRCPIAVRRGIAGKFSMGMQDRAITARAEHSTTFETPSRGSSTASAVHRSVCLSVCLSVTCWHNSF